ncbi:MAG TPA: ATP-binding cassette domain-containing protein, partial [Caldimonas sp.]|nr:ATP-binding cassette domain-containing protein [Caldimonas sp.]
MSATDEPGGGPATGPHPVVGSAGGAPGSQGDSSTRADLRPLQGSAILPGGRAAAPPAMLEIGDLHVAYGQVESVRGVSLTLGAGQIVSVIGPNGAGKTTL